MSNEQKFTADGQVLVRRNGKVVADTLSSSDISGGGGGGGGAPTNADYLVKTANTGLSAERVVTDTSTVSWDWATGGQAKANIVNNSVDNAKLSQSAGLSVLGRSANSTGNIAYITGANVGDVLQVLAGPTIGFGAPAVDAPTNAQYLTLATNGTLTAERVLTMSNQFSATDGGAGGNYTVNLKTPTLYNVYSNYFFNAVDDTVMSRQQAGTGAASSHIAGETGHPGILRLTTGSTATGRAAYATTQVDCIRLGGTGVVYRWDSFFRITTLSDGTHTYTLRLGFLDSVSGEPTDGVYFRYTHSANSGNWVGVARQNNTETLLNSSVAVTQGNWIQGTIICDGTAGSAAFYINGSSLGTALTTNIPTGTGRETGWGVCMIKSVGASGPRTLDIDTVSVDIVL